MINNSYHLLLHLQLSSKGGFSVFMLQISFSLLHILPQTILALLTSGFSEIANISSTLTLYSIHTLFLVIPSPSLYSIIIYLSYNVMILAVITCQLCPLIFLPSIPFNFLFSFLLLQLFQSSLCHSIFLSQPYSVLLLTAVMI